MTNNSIATAKVTVVVVNWNGAQYLERCLSALKAQTVKPHEIILLDNASSDGSQEIARRFPEVRLIALDENTGFARGNNLAIGAASEDAEWIALINPDAFAEPGWLEELLAAAGRNSGFDVFSSKLVNAADPEVLDGAGDAYYVSGRVRRVGKDMPVQVAPRKECEVFSPCAAAALYRRSAVLEVGGFDEDFFCFLEDVDLGFRLRLAGYRCLFVPASVAHHVGSGTTGGRHSDFSVYHGHRNLGVDVRERYARHLVLGAAAAAYIAESGEHLLVRAAQTGRSDLASEAGRIAGYSENVAQAAGHSEESCRICSRNLAGVE